MSAAWASDPQPIVAADNIATKAIRITTSSPPSSILIDA
jgi:hypothetical protein